MYLFLKLLPQLSVELVNCFNSFFQYGESILCQCLAKYVSVSVSLSEGTENEEEVWIIVFISLISPSAYFSVSWSQW